MRVLLCGGGTAGHINPALAIARKLQVEMPDIEIAFVGTPAGLENRLIPAAGFELYHVVVSGFKREFKLKNVSHNVRAAFYAVKSPHDANRILKEFKPDLVVGTGGYVSWPVLKAAAKQKIPTAIHEQNAMPGLTTRMLSKLVDLVFISYQESEKHFDCPADKLVLTGNPLRPELRTVEKSAERKRLGISEKERSVLAFGGSLGAKYVNYALFDWKKPSRAPSGSVSPTRSGNAAMRRSRTSFPPWDLRIAPILRSRTISTICPRAWRRRTS